MIYFSQSPKYIIFFNTFILGTQNSGVGFGLHVGPIRSHAWLMLRRMALLLLLRGHRCHYDPNCCLRKKPVFEKMAIFSYKTIYNIN